MQSTSLVPFADMLNHSNTATTHYVVHSGIESGNELNNPIRQLNAHQYRIKSGKLDMELLNVPQEDR